MLRLRKPRSAFWSTMRVPVAFVTLVVAIVGASVVASRSYNESHDLTAAARHDRREALVAERAIGQFWQQRESIGEYLLTPSRAVRGEITARQRAFERVVADAQPGSEQEAAYLAQAMKSNSELVAYAVRSSRRSPGRVEPKGALANLETVEQRVLVPLRALGALDKTKYERRESLASAAGRRALYIGLASALLAFAALAWFAYLANSLVRRIARQNDALNEANATKNDFVNTVSHELRTPITSIQGYLELLLDDAEGDADPLSDEQRGFLRTIARSSERLQRLVDDLLLVAQERAGQLRMTKRSCDLVEIARDAVVSAQALAAKNDLALDFSTSVEHAPTSADGSRLGQAFDNVISNAIKFTPAGGTIEVRFSAAGNCSIVTVEDSGTGMSAPDVDRLFEHFYRTKSARDEQIQGTGLGLAITKTILEAHGGSVSVASEPGVGTCLTISLPSSARDAAPQPPRRALAAAEHAA